MRSRTTVVFSALAIAAVPVVAVAGPATAAADAEARAEAAIATFEATVTEAGFEDDGQGLFSTPLDLADPEDEDVGHCFADLAALYDGEWLADAALASAASEDFFLPPDGEPLDTDDWDSYRDFDNTFAEVFVVDDDGADAVAAIVATFGSTDTADCVEAALSASLESQENASGSVAVSAEGDEDSAWLEIAASFTIDDEDREFLVFVGFARTETALATIAFSTTAGEADTSIAHDALAAMVDALDSSQRG